jgi:hypothetical protein
MIFTDDVVKIISDAIDSQLDQVPKDQPCKKDRIEVDLFPPGKCVHFYRDGVNFSACYVPNTFFSEIDVSRRMIDGKDVAGMRFLQDPLFCLLTPLLSRF